MRFQGLKHISTAVFLVFIALTSGAQEHHDAPNHGAEAEALNPGKVLMEHILDNHEYHFADVNGHPISIPLPVILYAPERGFSAFMSSRFEHGHAAYKGYQLVKDHENGHETIIAVDESGAPAPGVKVYDFSLTRNVTQMLLALTVLVLVMTSIARKYRSNGMKAPSGFQNAIEPVITFVRDDVAKPNLGHQYPKYLPYLLTVFFFILINNLFGLIPGSANVTGNIAVTLVLGLISLVVILFSTNRHFWAHIFNPPVPVFVKPILALVEFLGVFIKPVALIIRLFANMVAGHMIITCLILMIFIFARLSPYAGVGFSPVSIAFTVFIYVIEILVAFIQAFIFTNLTAVFIGLSLEGDHSHDEAAHHHA